MKLNYFGTRSKIPDLDVDKYLARLHLKREEPSVAYLKKLHKAHWYNIPVENLDLHYGESISLSYSDIFEKIVLRNRGGISFEVNALFQALLSHLGFSCHLSSAHLYRKDEFEDEFSHMIILIQLEESWIADVGMPGGFIDPKRIDIKDLQVDYVRYFLFDQDPDMNYLLKKSTDTIQFTTLYRFDTSEKQLIQFLPMVRYHESSQESWLHQNKLVFKYTAEGYVKLTEFELTTFLNGELKTQSLMNEDEFLAKLEEYFDINSYSLIHKN